MAKSIEFHFELYENSFVNDPVWSVQASSAFPAVSIGDRFEHRALSNVAWSSPPSKGQEFRVKDVDHIFWEVDTHIGHKLMVLIDLTELG
ncbi:hypothetical protein BWR59_16885 [Pseudomonas sp. Bc-h]|uniref:hypothetical protein n=1 Tax=Pseudomonas sp. Bc-h TaxID=1943632 RepID=UPI0009D9E1DA|nr:hypothetical protein [Pseudomonas sp. Bc-h]OQR30236.1 hypothetical protein BWR59_16885 [Pseudomonas sp. Bc-h]